MFGAAFCILKIRKNLVQTVYHRSPGGCQNIRRLVTACVQNTTCSKRW